MTKVQLMVSGLLTVAASAAVYAQPASLSPMSLNIEAQPLDKAITAWAEQTGYQVLMPSERAVSRQAAPIVKGTYTPESALRVLLASTDLKYQFVNARTVAIGTAGASASIQDQASSRRGASDNTNSIRLAEGSTGGGGYDRASDAAASLSGNGAASDISNVPLVLVTAQKRSERLQDVPVPVSAITAEKLIQSSQLRIQDYYASVPGLNVTPGIQSNNVLSVRGVTTGGGTNPTVGVAVDDVPYGASTNLGGGNVVPDIDPGDLAQVEVLRGPQGTLYGASSMGGLLKFVTVDPSTTSMNGRLQVGSNSVRNGDGLGYNVRGFVNVPLSESVALRASGFHRRDPGYVDNIQTGAEGVNRADADGGRLSMLWRVSDVWSLKLSALLQRIKGDGSSDVFVQPGLGDLQQRYYDFQGLGGYERKVQAYSATVGADFGNASLTALSGYNINAYNDSFDATWAFGPLPVGFFGVAGSPFTDDNKTKKFTQEIRLSAPVGQKMDWLLGVFYTHEHSDYVQRYLAADTTTGAVVGQGLESSFPTTYEEYAAFTDLTFRVTDRFDVQLGARESHINQTYTQTQTGPYVPILNRGAASPFVIPEVGSDANAFTYLLTPRFKVSPDLMVYVRLASGYRAGGPNPNPGGVVPPQYDPDKTQNYEIGLKGEFLDRRLSVDASVYDIIWKDIQISLLNPQTFSSYKTNGSRARSRGAELSVELTPLKGLTIGSWVAWNDAELTEPFQPGTSAAGADGDRLPFSSRFSGNLSVNQDFSLTGSMRAFVGGSLSYMSDRKGVFQRTPVRQTYPAYAKLDLRTGLRYDAWTADLFVNNVTDRRGALTGGLGAFPPFAFTYIQPRTVGLQFGYSFE